MDRGARCNELQLLTIEEYTGAGRPVTLLTARGSVTTGELPRLCDQLLVHVRHGRRHLLLDVADAHLDSSDTGPMLHDVHRRAQLYGCSFGVIGAGERERRGLAGEVGSRQLNLYRSLGDALATVDAAWDHSTAS